MAPQKASIAIIGGGIAGLSLALALHKRNISFTIYEQAHKFGEVGAGVGFTANAAEATKIVDEDLYTALQQIASHNLWEQKKTVFFDFIDATIQDASGHHKVEFTVHSKHGQTGVYRARFLDAMINLLPKNIAHFQKHVDNIEEMENGRLKLQFRDGTTEEADAVIGCDGLRSTTRQIIVGKDNPMAYPEYTHKYAYRALVDMKDALETIGEERAQNACLWMGDGRHVLTYPIEHGDILNMAAFVYDPNEWPDNHRSTLPASREQMLKDFESFSPDFKKLIEHVKPDLDIWSIFDLNNHPLDTYNKGRICLLGDAAHATSPHHGAGAGFCIEDSAIMSTLLAHPSVIKALSSSGENVHQILNTVFTTYTKVRKERTQWLVANSRETGSIYQWKAEGIGKDYEKMKRELEWSGGKIENVSVAGMCEEALAELEKGLTTG